jgi:hypothetical protein
MFLTVAATSACGDEPREAAMTSTAEADLIALDEAWIEAEVRSDRATLERILHEEFLVTYPSGNTVDRTTFIEGILKDPPAHFTVSHDSIQVFGDTAVVIDVSRDLIENREAKFTWIAIKRADQWRVISESISIADAD